MAGKMDSDHQDLIVENSRKDLVQVEEQNWLVNLRYNWAILHPDACVLSNKADQEFIFWLGMWQE